MSMAESIKDQLLRARCFLRDARGTDAFQRVQVRKPVELVGGVNDAGYGAWRVVAGSIRPDSIVYSVGVGDDISFDRALIGQYGVTVHAFDPTPQSHAWLARQADVPSAFVLHKVGLAGYDGEAFFHAHERSDWISHSMHKCAHTVEEAIAVPVNRLKTLMQLLGHDHVDLLKLDVEGAEYEVIQDLAESGLDVRQMLVEFHHRFTGLGPEKTKKAVRQLNELGFRVFYTSPRGEDYSFTRFS